MIFYVGEKAMLELIASLEHLGNARVPIRWCTGRKLLKKFKEEGVLLPHLLIIVTHGSNHQEVGRKLVPLNQLMEYMDFHSSGEHRIQATIVWHKNGDTRFLRARMLGGNYKGTSFKRSKATDHNGSLWFDEQKVQFQKANIEYIGRCKITINVNASFFAKEPAAWEKWWVNLWFQGEPRDQCNFGKRRFLAYLVQPFFVALYLIGLLLVRLICVGFLLSICRRNIDFTPLAHPFRSDTEDIWVHVGKGTVFTRRANGEKRPNWQSRFGFLSPLLFIVSSLVLLGYNRFSQDTGLSLLSLAGLVLLGQAVLTGFAIILIGVKMLFGLLLEKIEAFVKRVYSFVDTHTRFAIVIQSTLFICMCLGVMTWIIFLVISKATVVILGIFFSIIVVGAVLFWGIHALERKRELIRETRAKALFSDTANNKLDREILEVYDALACRREDVRVSLDALPRSSQTLYLRLQGLKSKLCKPFAI